MNQQSSLFSFLRNYKKSKSREFMLTSRVIHDLMCAAAANDYDLLVYTPTVDSDGFDLIIDDRDTLLPVQLKSMILGGCATNWEVHRKLLRPERYQTEWFGFEQSPNGEGRGGGIILIEAVASENTIDMIYKYTDIRILTALWLKLIKINKATEHRLDRLRNELTEKSSGKIEIPRTAFLQARSPEHLLALAGFYSRIKTNWPNSLYFRARNQFQNYKLSYSQKVISDGLPSDLRLLVVNQLR